MNTPTFRCAFSVRRAPGSEGYIGSYDIVDGAGDIVDSWQGKSALPTAALAWACVEARARAAVREMERELSQISFEDK